MSNPEPLDDLFATLPKPKIRDWLWRPLHAKLWWFAMPLYWGGMIASLHVEALASFYRSAFCGVFNVFFFPPLMSFILGFGYFRALFERTEFSDCEDLEGGADWQGARYGPLGLLRELDLTDPASGSRWIGSTLNPINPGYINRRSS
ncbi:hypothetical protein [Sphingobium sp. YR768]|uniref:hypothetical protein n=1 Tax=Sphingobium sp. YR768 TaxID=1884365 RepID=UPI000B87EBCB|nr:hypothetical protein [Sphingobium sp. YR768]